MSSFSLSGGVQVFGFISPSDTTDQYPVIDPLYGIDGFRNVDTLSDLNNIPTLRRRAGMVVGVSGGTTYYKLNLPPWNNTISDWSIFNTGSSGGTISGDYLPLSGGTVSGGTEFTNGLTANTISATTYLNLPQDIFVTGGTYSGGTITFTNNSGGTFNVTGVTFSGGSSVLGDYLPLSGGTVTGETIFTQGLYSNSENVGLIIDAGNLKRVGFMKYGGLEGSIARVSTQNFRILRTSGIDINDGTNAVTDFYIEGDGKIGIGTTTPITNLDVSGNTRIEGSFTANTISASTYLNLPQDIFLTGGTFDKNTETLTLTDITGGTITITGFTDTFVTGGTYSAGTTTFTNNSGGTFNVSGFYTGETSYVNSLTTGVGLSGDTTTGVITIINTDPDQVVTISGGTGITTGGTYPNFTITNSLPDQTVVLNNGTNIDVNGTYPNFTINVTGLTDNDTYITGFTYSANTFTIYQNSGSSLTSIINNVTGLTINGNLNVTGNTELSGLTTVYGDTPTSAAIAPGINNSYDLGSPSFRWREIYTTNIDATNVVTAYSLYSTYNTGVSNDLTVSGNTSLQNLTATTISATTYQNLPTDIRVTGGTYSGGTTTFTNNTGGTFNVSGYYTGGTDVFVTGGTYSAGTATFTNNSGGTFNVSGFYTGETSYVNSLTTGVGLSGDSTTGSITIINTDPDQVVTISGGTGITTGGTYPNFTITNSLPDQTVVLNSGTNIDVNGTYPNFTINVTGLTDNDTYVTGFTYSANTFTIYQNSGSSFDSTIDIVTGLTVNGNLTITGTTSSNTISATTYQNLPIEIQAAASDETTAITTGTTKVTFRAPCAFTLTSVRASLTTAQTSGNIFTVDINLNGTSVLSTKLTIDNTERTSTTAATPPVISTSSIPDDGEISVDVDQIGDGTAKGLKITLLGVRV